MNQGRGQMESCIFNQQGTIQTSSHIFQIMQLARNIPKDNKQYFLGITSWRHIGKLYRWFHNNSKDNGRTGRKDNQVPEDSGKTQSVFQTIKMRLQYGGNFYPKGNSGKGTSQDGTREDKGSERMENTNKSQRCWEFPWICQFLLMIHPQLQSHSKAIEQVKGQEGMEMGRGISKGVWRTQEKDNESTGPLFTKKRGKIQNRNRCIRICYRRSIIPRTRWEMETNSIFIKDNATSRKKLRDLWQEATYQDC